VRAVLARLARGARRIVGAIRQQPPLTLVAGVLVLAVLGTLFWQATRPSETAESSGASVRVGVQDGDSVPAYAAQSRAELARLAPGQSVYALVTLASYERPTGVATLIDADGVTTVQAYARVPLKDRQTEIVRLSAVHLPDDLVAAMTAVATRKDADALTEQSQAVSSTSVPRREFYLSEAAVDRAEAAAYRSACACVYAIVVRADPAVLRTLAGRKGVRIVDPAPEVTDPAHAVFIAPLPEQVNRVTPPTDTGLPTS
jgi:hypothetical protein